jgi:murein DD-endopeptidase MepM/ murein hydrolase activator NlpD
MRRAISLFVIVVLGAGLASAVARADGETGTTTTTTTATTDTTTTTTTTTATTTTTTSPTTTTTAPTYVPLGRSPLPQGCVGAGVAAIASSDGTVAALNPPGASLSASEYPASHPYLTFDSGAATGSGCTNGRMRLTNVSLFGGAVTAAAVMAADGAGQVIGLRVGGSPVAAKRGQTIAVGSWGLLELGAKNGRLSAPIALRLVYDHDSVPARTTIYIAFAALPQQSPRTVVGPVGPHPTKHVRNHRKSPHVPQPLTVTPPLGIDPSHYVFPVDGGASWGDTYGGVRNDIYDGWHHGDDLFAPLGTPLVAVVTGTLTLVGWNELGGWRIWLTDKKGNSFYYAHMAGYARSILRHREVKAGQVIGFLGRTGDAFTTPPHLHFEVHPHQFVKLGYDGAVDPTIYLRSWRIEHLPASEIPPAARLHAPAGTPTQEAAVVWGELLTARHLMPDGEPVVARTPSLRRPFPAAQASPRFVDARRLASSRVSGDAPTPWPAIALGLALAVLATAGSFVVLRRRRSA